MNDENIAPGRSTRRLAFEATYVLTVALAGALLFATGMIGRKIMDLSVLSAFGVPTLYAAIAIAHLYFRRR
jgi:hypothetical protein